MSVAVEFSRILGSFGQRRAYLSLSCGQLLSNVPLSPRVSEIVRFVDDYNVGTIRDACQVARQRCSKQVGMIEDVQVTESAEQLGEILFRIGFPYRFATGLGYQEKNLLSVVRDQAFDQH